MDPTVAALAGTVVGAGISSLVAWLISRQQTKHEQRLATAAAAEKRRIAVGERAGDFLAATYHAVLALRDYAYAEVADKPRLEKSEVWPTVDRVNRALTAIEVNEPQTIVDSVRRLDRALVVLARLAAERSHAPDEWSERRQVTLGTLADDVKAAVRGYMNQVQHFEVA
jgi:hypothetical protein